jgi:hypothetical protein
MGYVCRGQGIAFGCQEGWPLILAFKAGTVQTT